MKKNKVLESIKNILIIVLIVFAIYQFFDMYEFGDIGEITSWLDKDDETFYYMPSEVMISFGDKEFVKIKSGSNQEELVNNYIKEIYDLIFRTKLSFDESDKSVLSVMNDRSIILCYDDYNNFMLKDIFDISNERITRTLSKIDNIIICPGTTEGAKCNVYLYGNERLLKFEISIDTTELYGLIDEINMFKTMNIYLLSENYSYKKNFKEFVFIPAVIIESEMFDNDKDIKISNPFMDNGMFSDILLEEYINRYFNNPNAKWKMDKDTNTLIYGDGERTITAYKDGFVTYQNSMLDEKNINLDEAIKIANDKLDEDMYLSKYVKLNDVRKLSDSSYELYYDYYINDVKVELSNSIKNRYKIYYPLVVTIKGNDISNLKGVILKFDEGEITDVDETIKQDNKEILSHINNYDNVLNSFINEYPETMIRNFKLGYFKKNMIDDAHLMWIIETDKEYFTYDVYK